MPLSIIRDKQNPNHIMQYRSVLFDARITDSVHHCYSTHNWSTTSPGNRSNPHKLQRDNGTGGNFLRCLASSKILLYLDEEILCHREGDERRGSTRIRWNRPLVSWKSGVKEGIEWGNGCCCSDGWDRVRNVHSVQTFGEVELYNCSHLWFRHLSCKESWYCLYARPVDVSFRSTVSPFLRSWFCIKKSFSM